MITTGGRTFSDEILARIAATVVAEPKLSRRQLSLRVCEWMDWRNSAGRLQEMSCHKALLRLHERGRFAGTCYRAANWRHLGVTRGRGRQGMGGVVKDIDALPWVPVWQAARCRGTDGAVCMRPDYH